ncbi:MAG: RC-LH1 core complex protein PufX [Rhodobacteraceae bacterium]|nr:RC-LH1 core complex protein PufX [Paracoccaceae bacterium]
MSDNLYYHEKNPTIHLRTWVLGQMAWGAFLAGIVLTGAIVFVVVLYIIGQFLPEESRKTPDPMPRSSLEQPLTVEGHDLA